MSYCNCMLGCIHKLYLLQCDRNSQIKYGPETNIGLNFPGLVGFVQRESITGDAHHTESKSDEARIRRKGSLSDEIDARGELDQDEIGGQLAGKPRGKEKWRSEVPEILESKQRACEQERVDAAEEQVAPCCIRHGT